MTTNSLTAAELYFLYFDSPFIPRWNRMLIRKPVIVFQLQYKKFPGIVGRMALDWPEEQE